MVDTKFKAAKSHRADQSRVQIRRYRRGETVIHAGSALEEWIAISRGAASLSTPVAGGSRVAVATLWFGDVVGCGSPIGNSIAGYDVSALVDLETVAIERSIDGADAPGAAAHLYASTAMRLNRQIAMRLAGNGPQRLASVLATLATALFQRSARQHQPIVSIPMGRACIGDLAGLSRRQVWVYLGELASAGWIRTARSRLDLLQVSCWLLLQAEVERLGLSAIATIDDTIETLTSLSSKGVFTAVQRFERVLPS